MINFRIYNMNEHELIASKLSKEEAIQIINNIKQKRIMIIKHDTETKSDEIVNINTLESYTKGKRL